MIELKNGIWIVVADQEKALFLRNLTDHQDPNFQVIRKEEFDSEAFRPENEAGRRADKGPNQKSAVNDADEWHDLARDSFARDLADILYRQAHKGAFRHIVIAAAPDVLGALREEMHKEVADKVVAEIPKTLTNHPVDQLEKVIKAELDAM